MPLRSLIIRNLGTLSLATTLALSLGFNVYLARRVDFHSPRQFKPISENAKLPPSIGFIDANGNPAKLSFNGNQPTVVYVFSPVCPWCRQNEANIRALVAAVGGRYRIVGLSTVNRDLKRYIADGRAPFPVYVMKSQDQMRQLGILGTPETLVVDANSKVEKVWTGAYLNPTINQVEKYFDVTLPGMKGDAAASGVSARTGAD